MAEKNTIARPYAVAAFGFAKQADRLTEWSEMLNFAATVIEDPAMQAVWRNPKVGAERAAQLFLDICGEQLDEPGVNLIKALAENKRLGFLPEVAGLFDALKKEAESQVEVEVVSAYPMTGEQQTLLSDALNKRFGKKVILSSRVDEELIGGVLVRVGDKVIDGSLRGRIEQLSQQLGI